MIKIGLTGSRGWLGSYVKSKLEIKYEIINLDDFTKDPLAKNNLNDNLKLDWVFHFGAKTNIAQSFDNPFEINKLNILSTISALEIAYKNNAKFLFLSSYIYGEPQYNPIDEEHPIKPNNPYMISKWLSEQTCINLSQFLKVPCFIFRLFNVYGPGIKKGRLISDLIQNANESENLKLNDKFPVRDYLYVDDFVKILEMTLVDNRFVADVYNVGSGFSYSNLEVAELVQSMCKKNLKIDYLSKPRKNDIQTCLVNNEKIKKKLNWEPDYDLNDGLKNIFNSKIF